MSRSSTVPTIKGLHSFLFIAVGSRNRPSCVAKAIFVRFALMLPVVLTKGKREGTLACMEEREAEQAERRTCCNSDFVLVKS